MLSGRRAGANVTAAPCAAECRVVRVLCGPDIQVLVRANHHPGIESVRQAPQRSKGRDVLSFLNPGDLRLFHAGYSCQIALRPSALLAQTGNHDGKPNLGPRFFEILGETGVALNLVSDVLAVCLHVQASFERPQSCFPQEQCPCERVFGSSWKAHGQ